MNRRNFGTAIRKIRWPAIFGFTLVCLVGLTACGRNSHIVSEPQALMVAQAQRAPSAHGSTLSREHFVTIEVAESDLHSSFQRLSDRCTADSANHCTILQSDVSSGQFSSGLIKLRIDPSAVEGLIGFAAGLGRLEHRSTQVEDQADAIQDTQSRIAMLTTYRKQLLESQGKAGTNIDAAICSANNASQIFAGLCAAVRSRNPERSRSFLGGSIATLLLFLT